MTRQRFPRQSATSAAASQSTSDVATPTASSDSIIGSQTSLVGTVTDVTTGITSILPTSSTPTSSNPALATNTVTSGSPTTTSTSPTLTSPTPTITSTTTLTSPTTSGTTSSAPASSSSALSSSTTQPSRPSSTQQEFVTTITSAFTTYISGSPVLSQTAIPTTIPYVSGPSSSTRTAIIAGSAAGGTALLILLLTLAFCARRKRFKRLDFLDAITLKRKRDRSRATLLDGEYLDTDLVRSPIRYTDYDTPWDARGPLGTAVNAVPSRWSETGSAFREDVWPPPNEVTQLMDPFARTDDPDLDLSRIVDDVMGPSPAAGHYSDRSVSSMYRDSVAESDGQAVHSRTVSNASNMALLEAAGLAGPTTAPVRSSPLAQPETGGS